VLPFSQMSKFSKFLKWLFASLSIVALIWALVIIWWQTTHRIVTTSDTLLYLAALPAAAIAGVAMAQWLRAKLKNPNLKSNEKTTVTAAPNEVEHKAASDERNLPLAIMAAWGVTSLAANASDYLELLKERRVRPRPDEILTDDEGFPLFTGRVKDLDVSSIQEYLAKATASGKFSLHEDDEWRDAFVRTLALLARVLDQVQEEWPFPSDFPSRGAPESQAFVLTLRGAQPATPAVADKRLRLNLHIKLLIPAHFREDEKHLASAYLSERVSVFQSAGHQLRIELQPAQDDALALSLSDRFGVNTCHDSAAQALLLLACDSALCDSVAEAWQANEQLFSNKSVSGLMMGEAAFGVLYANENASNAVDAVPLCRQARVAQSKRDSSADIQIRSINSCLIKTLHEALALAEITGDSIGTVICDADHRTSRVLECMDAMMNATPQLDAIQNRIAVNEACGHLGAASVLGMVVAGAMQIAMSSHPLLLFNVSHATDRAAAVLLPPENAYI
jgi:hypothetical protein